MRLYVPVQNGAEVRDPSMDRPLGVVVAVEVDPNEPDKILRLAVHLDEDAVLARLQERRGAF